MERKRAMRGWPGDGVCVCVRPQFGGGGGKRADGAKRRRRERCRWHKKNALINVYGNFVLTLCRTHILHMEMEQRYL